MKSDPNRPADDNDPVLNRQTVRAVVFDLGNVLVSLNWGRAVERFAERTPFSVRELVPLFLQNGGLAAYEKGEIDDKSFFSTAMELLRFRGSREEFIDLFSDIFAPITDNIALVNRLSYDLPLAVLSNTNPAHVAHLERNFDFLKLFAEKIYSFAVGLRKPDSRIYHRTAATLGVNPRDILFVDDRREHVEGARTAGWRTVHFKQGMDLKSEFRRFGLAL